MAEVGSYYVTVMPNMSQFNSALAKGAKSAGSLIGDIGLGTAIGNALSAGVSTFLGSLDRGISRLDTLESFPRIMENVGIDADASARAIQTLSTMIDGLPTSLDAAAAATQRFALQNGDVEHSAELFGALNNALLAGGKSAAEQASTLEQVSQAYSKGKPDMIEWRSMLTTMGPAMKMVARSWGMSVDDMGEALRSGDRSMDEFLETLVNLNETGIDEFASLSEQASVSTGNLGTAIDLIGTRFAASWAMIIDAIGREDIVNAINGFTSGFKGAVEDYVVPAITTAKETFGDLVEASQPIQDAFSDLTSKLADQFAPAFEGVTQALADNAPTIEDVVGAISGAIQFLSDNIETIETVAIAFAAFSALSALIPIFSGIAAAVTWLGGAFATLAGAGSIGAALLGIVATIGTVPVIIGAVATAVALLIMNWEAVKGFFVELGNAFLELGGTFLQVTGWIDKFFGEDVPNAIDSALRTIGGYVQGFLDSVGGVIDSIVTFFTMDVPNAVNGAVNAFRNFVSSVPGMIGGAVESIKAKFQSVLDFVKSIPGRIAGFFSGLGSRIGNAIGSIHFPTPHVSWEGTAIPGLSIPKIQWYGAGGFVNGARLIGAGERGTELIWPSYGAALNKYANAIAQRMPEGAGAEVTNVYLNDLRVNDDERIRADVLNLVTDLGRYSAMNRG